MNKIKLTKEQLDLFFYYSNIISTSNEEWFNIPFWFKRIDEDTFELFLRNELPKELLEEKDVENKIIHFAEWLTGKHTTELITLYEHFNNKYYENHN